MVARRREYLQLLDASKAAAEAAVDCFNRVRNPYRNESTLILLANAWELLAKAVLVHARQSIVGDKKSERSISAQVAVDRVMRRGLLDNNQASTVQQVISFRHIAVHHVLPEIDDEIIHHLLYFSLKFFRETVEAEFPRHAKDLPGGFLSLSFDDLTTYADRVQKAVSRVRRSPDARRLVWALERGVAFDGSKYLTETDVETKYKGTKKIMPHLSLGDFTKTSDMVRIVPVEAPKNFTADITLRKGSAKDAALPVVVKKTVTEDDYPYLTKELAAKIGKSLRWTTKAASVLGLKGDPKCHQAIRVSSSNVVQRYSDAALQKLKMKLTDDPSFDPHASG